jgi:uncharacterized membrane protein YphA (DoxX/SURF4 family)
MLNTFPELLNYSLLSPALLRWLLAFVLISVGIEILKPTTRALFVAYFSSRDFPLANFLPWKLGVAQIVLGIFFIFGIFTQVSALVAIYVLFSLFYIENRVERILPHTSMFYLTMIIIATSLLFSGAGAFAVDLPL